MNEYDIKKDDKFIIKIKTLRQKKFHASGCRGIDIAINMMIYTMVQNRHSSLVIISTFQLIFQKK